MLFYSYQIVSYIGHLVLVLWGLVCLSSTDAGDLHRNPKALDLTAWTESPLFWRRRWLTLLVFGLLCASTWSYVVAFFVSANLFGWAPHATSTNRGVGIVIVPVLACLASVLLLPGIWSLTREMVRGRRG